MTANGGRNGVPISALPPFDPAAETVRLLRGGTGLPEGSLYIQQRYTCTPPLSEEERLALLRREYADAGRSWPLADGRRGWLEQNSDGLHLRGGGRTLLRLSWQQMDRALLSLTAKGEYLTGEGLREYEQWQTRCRMRENARAEQIRRAANLIADYCERERLGDPDLTDPTRVPLAYTVTDEGLPLQVWADLDLPALVCVMADGPPHIAPWPDLDSFCTEVLEDLTFDDLYSHAMDVLPPAPEPPKPPAPPRALPPPQPAPSAPPPEAVPADRTVPPCSYVVSGGRLFYREDALMYPVHTTHAAEARIRSMIPVRDALLRLLDAQAEGLPDARLDPLRTELEQAYTACRTRHGPIGSPAMARAFREDGSHYLIQALEIPEEGHAPRRSGLFTQRVLRPDAPPASAPDAQTALAVSLSEKGRVDPTYMAALTGSESSTLIAQLSGRIFKDPADGLWHPADEYLSGNVREKLLLARTAAGRDPVYAPNVQALSAVQPPDLPPEAIALHLGAPWIEPATVCAFAHDLARIPPALRHRVQVYREPHSGAWYITGKEAAGPRTGLLCRLEHCLNGLPPSRGEEADHAAVEEVFRAWVHSDPDRRSRLAAAYDRTFNAWVPRHCDGSILRFPGMNPAISLRPHQRNATARILFGGSTLLAHPVGAGKTFVLAAAAMEKKRLGLCRKSLLCVPGHLIRQTAAEVQLLYPAAKVLALGTTDFERSGRERLLRRIAAGDWDLVITAHSRLASLPMSAPRQTAFLTAQLEQAEAHGRALRRLAAPAHLIRQADRLTQHYAARLETLAAAPPPPLPFEELGIDNLMVDEAHLFKNLTCISRRAGATGPGSRRADDLLMKADWLREQTGGGLVLSTGTPVTNSMTELHTTLRFLCPQLLQSLEVERYDDWAAAFTEMSTAPELTPEGTGQRIRTRPARFCNLPELMALVGQCADLLAEDALPGVQLPALEGGGPINLRLSPSVHQQRLCAELARRAEAVRSGAVPTSEDNLLKITTDGRRLALDQRLADPTLPDDPHSKVNLCAERVAHIHSATAEQKGTQLVFCDLSTPKPGAAFSLYADLRTKLMARGVPAAEIRFIHEAATDAARAELFDQVRAGRVRVLIGSTAKLGAGTNIQRRLAAVHHLDVPWRPADLRQREGRLLRQGNEMPSAAIYRYVTEGTFDAYSWQLLEHKQRFIGQLMSGTAPARTFADPDEEALSYAEVKALASGDPLVREQLDAQLTLSRLHTEPSAPAEALAEAERRLAALTARLSRTR